MLGGSMREHLSTYRDVLGRRTNETVIDGMLEDSFPASDPPCFPCPPATKPRGGQKWLLLGALILLFAVSAAEVAAHKDHAEQDRFTILGVSTGAAIDERMLFNDR
jgi:hypothetical protein